MFALDAFYSRNAPCFLVQARLEAHSGSPLTRISPTGDPGKKRKNSPQPIFLVRFKSKISSDKSKGLFKVRFVRVVVFFFSVFWSPGGCGERRTGRLWFAIRELG